MSIPRNVNRRTFLQGTLGATPASAAPAESAAARDSESGPARHRSIIYVLTDDQRHDALGFLKARPFLKPRTWT